MAADVNPIAFIVNGPGNATNVVALLKNNRHNIGSRQEFKSGREASRAGAYDDGAFTMLGR